MSERRCDHCGGPIPAGRRGDSRYCSDSHRVLAHRARRRAERTQLVPPGPVAESPPLLDRQAQLELALERALDETRLVAVIAAEARSNWRASAWLLSRRFPERWGERGRELPVLPAVASSDDPFAEVVELAARRRRKPDGY